MKTCWRIGKVIDFSPTALYHCCTYTAARYPYVYSFNGPKICNFSGGTFPLETYVGSVSELRIQNNSDSPPCVGCEYLVESLEEDEFKSIAIINVNNYKRCNLRCVYCIGGNECFSADDSYNLTETLQDMYDRNIITSNTVIAWGGENQSYVMSLHAS